MKVRVYLKKPTLDKDEEYYIDFDDIEDESIVSGKAFHFFGMTGVFCLTGEDHKSIEIIPRENVERISCVLSEPRPSPTSEVDEFDAQMNDEVIEFEPEDEYEEEDEGE